VAVLVRSLCAFLTLSVALFATSPSISGIVNPASNIPPGLPNYGIAQGSIFVVYGANLGPASLVQASSWPLPTTGGLSGTSITVTVGGMTISAPMIYTVQSQVAAVLPSNTPAGTGTLNLTYNGTNVSSALTVVGSNFGISTVNQSGGGPAVVTNPDYSLVDASHSAKPGDVVIIWGTGLGPISGSDAILPNPTDLGTPIHVFVGGVEASVLYRGRSADPGLDQINIVIPQGFSPGCWVSLVIQTNGVVSNTTSVAAEPNGGVCSDPMLGPWESSVLTGKDSYALGTFTLALGNAAPPPPGFLGAIFYRLPAGEVPAGESGNLPSLGNCTVVVTTRNSVVSAPLPASTRLSAGTSLTLTMPSGTAANIPNSGTGGYAGKTPAITPGNYQISNGSGSSDIPAFTASVTVPIAFTWTNPPATNATLDHTQPLSVQWQGGDPAGIVYISMYENTADLQATATGTCIAPVSAGQFVVPANVMRSFPPTAKNSPGVGIQVQMISTQILSIPTLDLTTFQFSSLIAGGALID
jgi:uncharacterized protein (TIGR03437 family)